MLGRIRELTVSGVNCIEKGDTEVSNGTTI